MGYEQSVAHYARQGFESTNKIVGIDNSTLFAQRLYIEFQRENHNFIFSV